jgi:hypothetical protein
MHNFNCRYADLVIHTSCPAFVDKKGQIPYLNELMWEDPDSITVPQAKMDNENCQGSYHYLNDSPADLKLVCNELDERGIKYHVFFDWQPEQGATPSSYVIWTPEMGMSDFKATNNL